MHRKRFVLALLLLLGGTAFAQSGGVTIKGSVFGGGAGIHTSQKSGSVTGNTTVTMNGGTVERSIYGGGQLGSVGTFTDSTKVKYDDLSLEVYVPTECQTGTGVAKVVMAGGSVGKNGSLMPFTDHDPDDDDRGWIFCGSKGEADSITYPHAIAMGVVGSTYLEIRGTVENPSVVTASVYGGCENGLVLRNTHVVIKDGCQIGTGYRGVDANGDPLFDNVYGEDKWTAAIDAVRSEDVDDINTAAGNFHECHHWPYGDGSTPPKYYVYDIYSNVPSHPNNNPNNAAYNTSALTGSDGHSFFGNVFGGGSGYYPIAPGIWRYTAGQVNGNATVDIKGGHILTSVYGGNESTDVKGKVTINMSGGTVGVPRTQSSIEGHPVTCSMFGGGMGDPRVLFNTWTNVNESEVNVTGGMVFGSVFGGGEEGHVLGDVAVTISGENTIVGTLGYSGYEGNVFGAGRGFSGEALTAGTIGGNAEIAINDGKVLGSVYGGGRNASVGTQFTAPSDAGYGQFVEDGGGHTYGHVVIDISGGTIGNIHEHPADGHTQGGNVYGGSMGHIKKLDNTTYNPLWPSMARVKSTHVNITGGTIKSIVYGGAEYGSVRDSAVVVINDPDASIYKVFGGGYGTSDITYHENDSSNVAAAKLAGRVQGNTLVKILKGTIQTSVYGGGEFASVGMVKDNTLLYGNTNVVVKGGTIGNKSMYATYDSNNTIDEMGHVFGGGQGALNDPDELLKDYCNVNYTNVNVSGGRIYGSVFGGGADSHVLDSTSVFIHSNDTIGNTGMTSWDGCVFGGGKGNGRKVNGKFVAYKTKGRVGGNTYVSIDTCRLMGSVFGGGRTGLTGIKGTDDDDKVVLFLDNAGKYDSINHGRATIVVTGKAVGSGKSITYSTNIGTSIADSLFNSDESVGDIYGGGKGDTDFFDDIWAGRTANNRITVTGSPRIYGGVFGGGEQSGVGYYQSIDPTSGVDCGQFYEKTGATSVTVGREHKDDNPVIGTEAEFVISKEHSYWTIYDTINNVVMLNHTCTGNVFGGGQGDVNAGKTNWVTMARARTTYVNVHGGTIMGCVHGGGEQGTVIEDTHVNVTGGKIGDSYHSVIIGENNTTTEGNYHYGSVYGGGYGDLSIAPHTNDSSNVVGTGLAGRVYGNTYVNVSGGDIYENVFGGGNLASVGFVKNGELKNGLCTVIVSDSANVGVALDGTGLNGYVYGGGKGVGNDPDNPATINVADEEYKSYCNANGTSVTVNLGSKGRIHGSLYGGGSDAHVLGNTLVTLNGGTIGPDDITEHLYGGNIFGGGRNFLKKNYTGGRVGGNTHVVMNNGTVKGSVFGGGRMALTGIDENGSMQEDVGTTQKFGWTKVELKGGSVGEDAVVNGYTDRTNGDVYGGGKGDMTGLDGHPDASALLVAMVKNTEVEVSGTARIYGIVFGGGEVANVGEYSWNVVEEQPYIQGLTIAEGTGKTKVTVSGGTIGAGLMRMRPDIAEGAGNYDLKYNDDVGHVYGGGEGRSLNPTLSPIVDTEQNRLVDLMATVGSTDVTISGTAWVKGSVYGGAAMGHVRGDAKVTVSGGQIGAGYYPAVNETLAMDKLYEAEQFFNPITYFTDHPTYTDIANADTLKECVSWAYDPATNRFFDPVAMKANPVANCPTNGHSWFGSVYGGGSGYYPYITTSEKTGADTAVWNPNSGRVYGNTKVTITGGHILTNVYGGGEVADMGTRTSSGYAANTGKAVVKMKGGTVGVPRKIAQIKRRPFTSNIFGAGKGDSRSGFNALSNVVVDSVVISDNAIVYGCVFGGAEVGHVIDSTNVLVKKDDPAKTPVIGTTGFSGYDGHVFGAGWGNRNIVAKNSNWAAGRVGGNAHVTMTDGAVLGNLYGGGFVARVGVGEEGGFDTYVTVTIEGEDTTRVYQSEHHGLARVDISGGYVGNNVNSGRLLLMSDEKAGNVFGGGRGDPTEHIEDDFGRVANSVANVSGSPHIYGNVFGGGQMANSGHWNTYANWYTDGTSETHANVKGSPIIGTELEFNYADYLSKTGANAPKYTEFDTINGMKMVAHTRTGNVYGGGQGDLRLKTEGTWRGHPEGFEQGHCGLAEVNIQGTPTIMSSVFGGSDQGVVWGDTKVTIAGGTIGKTKIPYDSLTIVNGEVTASHHTKTYSCGSVYGGSYGMDAYKHVDTHAIPTQYFERVVDSINRLTGCVYGNTEVNITGGNIRGNVFGGGDMANVGTKMGESNLHASNGICTVKISATANDTIGPLDGTGLNAYVFGGGKGFYSDPDKLRKKFANVDSTFVIVSSGKICGSIFGGGNDSHTLGSTSVIVKENANIGIDGITTWDGNIFGGGRNFVNSNHTNGRVAGNINVTMSGGTIQGSIFGGGRLALTGVDENGAPFLTAPDSHEYDSLNHGMVTINVSGGSIGNSNGNLLLNGSDESVGDIFGSGKGDTKNYEDVWAGRVANTKITVSGTPRIYGSVFGGGEMASIGYWYTDNNNPSHPKSPFYGKSGASEVTINGGTIGTYMEIEYNYAHPSPGDEPSYWTVFNYNAFNDNDTTLLHTCTGNVFGGCQGDVDTISPAWVSMGRSRTATVTINGGTIMSHVFGGAEQGSVAGNTSVTVNGGTIGSWANYDKPAEKYLFGGVFGGGYGSHNPIFNGTVTDYYHTAIENDSTDYLSNNLWTADHLAGRVYGSTSVDILDGTIRGDVFGGASFAYVGDYSSSGDVLVNVGKVTSRTDTYEGNAEILGSIFGANNYAGTPNGNVNVNIYSTKHTGNPDAPAPYTGLGNSYPTVPTGLTEEQQQDWLANLPTEKSNFAIYQVFGGSNQADYTPAAGKKATVHVYDCSSNTIYDLYGGSNAAAIGTSSQSNDANLIIDGGRIHRVFGGGNGEDKPADIHGTAKTDIHGGLINQVFGGSNNEGLVDVVELNIDEGGSCPLIISDVFGGGNNALVIGDVVTTVECCDASYGNFYGGNSLADLYGNVTVNIFGATYNNLFAGSKGQVDNPATTDENEAISANIKKFPASIPDPLPGPDDEGYDEVLDQVYRYMLANGGDDLCGTGGNVTLNLFGGTINQAAFGGSDANGNIEGQITVNVFNTATSCNLDMFDLYGASRNTPYHPLDPTITSPVVNVIHGTVGGSVYGGGQGAGAEVKANPKVNMGYYADLGVYGHEGDVMDMLFDTIHVHADQPDHPWVAPTDYLANVYGNIYGGGNYGQVDGSTTVNVYKGEIGQVAYTEKTVDHTPGTLDSLYHVEYDIVNRLVGGSVYGGGKGSYTVGEEDRGLVKGNATVNISGGHVQYNVYGGGEMASVGLHDNNFAPIANTGLATVNITGGQVGPAPRCETGYNVAIGLNGTDGYVFGGGKGKGDDPIILPDSPYGAYYKFANVNNALVTINIPMPREGHPEDSINNRLWGSVFGGAEDGHVLGDARVNFVSGFMGTTGTTSYDGNIFGGGRNYSHKNYTAGRVGGNTTVEMTGGQLFGNIYGGGRLALTGAGLTGMIPATGLASGYYQAMQEGPDHGHAKVMVKGGTLGNNKPTSTGDLLIETFTEYSMGNVFGGGMGILEGIDIEGHPKASSLLFGMTKSTEVEISGTTTGTHVYGIVFGGGEIANVGKFTWHQNNETLAISDITVAEGKAQVTISGGTIGADRAKMRYQNGTGDYAMYPMYNDDLGYVYGAGAGYSDDPDDEKYLPKISTSVGDLSILDLMSTVYESEVTINGGWVKASVFGGAESGHVIGNTKVTINGGQIGAGHNDVNLTDLEDKLYGNDDFINPTTDDIPSDMYGTYHWEYASPYTPYDPVYAMSSTYEPLDGKSWFGNVFGGGSGWFPYIKKNDSNQYQSYWNPNSGKVWGNSEVIITGGHILNNVYGANESTNVEGKATVKMSGGTVGVPLSAERYAARPHLGYIFGGGGGDPREVFDGLTNVDSTYVQITGGIVYGSVIGGAEDGHVLGDTKVTVSEVDPTNKPTVIGSTGKSGYDGNIFGGGRNFMGNNKNAGHVTGKTTINMSDGVALGNVYGGGRSGSVDESTHVNISGGQVGTEQIGVAQATILNGNVYGGGLGFAGGKKQGNAHEFGNVDSTYVNISGTAMIYNSVFGGGEDGHVLGSTVINMTGGTVGQRNTLAELTVDEYEQPTVDNIYTGNVIGGGKGISTVGGVAGAYNDTTGIVFGNTNVSISGGTVRHAVYGGGGLSHVGTFTRDATTNEITFTSGGKCTVEVKGTAHIGPTKADVESYSDANTFFKNLGGNAGSVFGAGCGLVGQGFDVLTFNDSTLVTIGGTAQVTGSVFGGGESGHVKNNTRVLVSGGTIGGIPLHGTGSVSGSAAYAGINFTSDVDELTEDKYGAGRRVVRGNVYGGGKGNDFVTTGVYDPHAGRVYGDTKVTIEGGTIYNRVFGGGSMASVGVYSATTVGPEGHQVDSITGLVSGGTATVLVKGGTIGTDGNNNGDVFGGGRGLVGRHWDEHHQYNDQVVYMAYVGNTNVTIETGADIKSNVYGGSANGHVQEDTHVIVDGGTIGIAGHGGWHSNVYGGGGGQHQYQKGSSTHFSITSGRVYGNTKVEVKKGTVYHNVYGGGAIASVGTYNIYDPEHLIVSGGKTEVIITGDADHPTIIGTDGYENGLVFGSGRGEIDAPDAFMDSLSFAVNTEVTIGTENSTYNTYPKVNGSVYGSGENGHVYEKTLVKVYSGTIGCTAAEYEAYAADPTTYASQLANFPYRGNVYGAGCGTDKYKDITDNKWKYNPKAGIVYGDAKVEIHGGYISRNVYGGGAMASVGNVISAVKHETGYALSWPYELTFLNAGFDSATGGKAEVEIKGGHIGTVALANEPLASGCVFGSSRGDAGDRYEMALLANAKEAHVTVDFTPDGTSYDDDTENVIIGSVFGSGESGHVYDDTHVTVTDGLVVGSVFGGGDGTATYKDLLKDPNDPGSYQSDSTLVRSITAGKVYGNTHVTVSDGYILQNVYGGGNMASVGIGNYAGGWHDYSYGGYGEQILTEEQWADTTNRGHCYVNILGGTLGTLPTDLEHPESVFNESIPNGSVFGGSRGVAVADATPAELGDLFSYRPDMFLGYVNHTHVKIGETASETAPRLYGSLYGGAQNGHVRWNANVVINKGEIGANYGTDDVGSSDLNSVYWKDRGNVFGAGSGIGLIDNISGAYSNIAGSVTQKTNVIINGGTIHRNVYGGGDLASVGPPRISQDHDCPIDSTCVTVTINAGALIGPNTTSGYGGYVYGGARGIASNTGQFDKFSTTPYDIVTINGGTIEKDVFGGGENGQVTVAHPNAQLVHTTEVTINNATINGNVYGGGKGTWGNDGYENDKTSGRVMGTATVNLNSGTVGQSVFGGGEMGITHGETYANITDGEVMGRVFGGAYGKSGQNHVLGRRMVNMRGGTVKGNVYGGSFYANDGFRFESDNDATAAVCVVNISGGEAFNNVFGAGFFGNTYGSTYVFIGTNAILNAPHHTYTSADPTYTSTFYNTHQDLVIGGDIYAGADFGTYDPNTGQQVFGEGTVSGYSDIYVDGQDYDTYHSVTQNDNTFMFIGRSSQGQNMVSGALFGSGTMNDAGRKGKVIIVRNYGHDIATTSTIDNEPYTNATRYLQSIQYADTLVIENSHIHLTGRGMVNEFLTTTKYAIINIDEEVRVVNGSSLYVDKQVKYISNLYSVTCPDVYATKPDYTVVTYDDLKPNQELSQVVATKDNKIRLNKGQSLFVTKYIPSTGEFVYGALIGFFHLMTDGEYNATAYARPKQSQDAGNVIHHEYVAEHNHPDDGGFVSYRGKDYNLFNKDGGSKDFGNEGPYIQMPYENHTPLEPTSKELVYDNFYRIWRYYQKQAQSVFDVVLHAIAKPDASQYYYTDFEQGTVELPASSVAGSFYRIKSVAKLAQINYGSEIVTVNSGMTSTIDTTHWMYYGKDFVYTDNEETDPNFVEARQFMKSYPNNAFGLVAIPQGSLVYTSTNNNQPWLLCTEANDGLIAKKWTSASTQLIPKIQFMLTYSGKVDANHDWDPISVTLEQVYLDENEEEVVTDEVVVNISISTLTLVEQDNHVETFAMMTHTVGGDEHDTYKAKVMLPAFERNDPAENSVWTLTNVEWKPNTTPGANTPNGILNKNFNNNTLVKGDPYTYCQQNTLPTHSYAGMTLEPSNNSDNTPGWLTGTTHEPIDLGALKGHGPSNPISDLTLGVTTGQTPFSFDFTLNYDSKQNVGLEGNVRMGTIELTMHFTNYKNGDPKHEYGQDVKFYVDVLRRGKGKGFYIDGVNGAITYSGKYPDAAQPHLAGVLYFADDYEPVDTIYIVRTVTADAVDNLEWNTGYDQLNIFRYPGGHPLHMDVVYPHDKLKKFYSGYVKDAFYNEENGEDRINHAFRGTLVDVVSSMSVSSAIVDGAYNLKDKIGRPESPDPTHAVSVVGKHVIAEAPMFNIQEGGVLSLDGENNLMSMQNNYNLGSNGGAVNVATGATLRMHKNAQLENNFVKDGATETHHGGGAYVTGTGTILVSDDVYINTNHHVNTADDEIKENVYLNDYGTMISLGSTDGHYGILNKKSRIGITKTAWDDKEYMPIVNMETISLGDNLLSDNGDYGVDDIVFDQDELFGLLPFPFREDNGDPNCNRKLYWVMTWTKAVTSCPDDFDPEKIDTPEKLAWAISIVNGLNGATPDPSMNFSLTRDLDMSQYIWVPIGIWKSLSEDYCYKGTFEGNGHLVTGIHSPFNVTDKGMFGNTQGGQIKNLQAVVHFYDNVGNFTTSYLGGLVGNMDGGLLVNCESSGYLESDNGAAYIGGLVGKTWTSGTIHSCFAVDTIYRNAAGMIAGGLVGRHSNRLLNSYSRVVVTDAQATGFAGLVGENDGLVENCYADLGNQGFPAFAVSNMVDDTKGTINYCYANVKEGLTYVSGKVGTMTGYGNFAAVKTRKEIGYMYDDNAVSVVSGDNPYDSDQIYYTNSSSVNMGHITRWPGLLSALNEWVKDDRYDLEHTPGVVTKPTPWFRPTTSGVNADLPVLAFPGGVAMVANHGNDRFLRYNASLDELLDLYADNNSDIFLYGNAVNVANVPSKKEHVYVNEDAVLLQKANADSFINTTVGITFDNSSRSAVAYGGIPLEYDWHLMATPLSNAKMGTTYSHKDESGAYTPDTEHQWAIGASGSPVDVSSMVDSYFPNGLEMGSGFTGDEVKWDFYNYFEPEYHWINLKRNKKNHFHQETVQGVVVDRPYQEDGTYGVEFRHYQIYYEGDIAADQADNDAEDANCNFVPGKGYMMAISQDSYMSSTGILNQKVTVPITASAPEYVYYMSANRGSNLVGNPYQAYLDLNKVTEYEANKPSTNPISKFWVYDADVTGTVNGVAVKGVYKPYEYSASKNPELPSRYVHPHQGFFVVTNEDATLNFTPDMAGTHNEEGSTFRSEEPRPAFPLVNLFVTDEEGNADLAIVEFNRPETGGVPKIDNLRNAEFKLYARFDDEDWGLLYTPINTERVPVFFKTPNDGTYTLSWSKYNGTFNTMRLIDNIAGVDYDMLTHDSYTFQSYSNDYSARFYIVFGVTGVDETDDDNNIFAFNNGDGWVVNGSGQLELVDMLGHVLYTNHLDGKPTLVHFRDVAAGVYMLRLVDSQKVLNAQKIVIY